MMRSRLALVAVVVAVGLAALWMATDGSSVPNGSFAAGGPKEGSSGSPPEHSLEGLRRRVERLDAGLLPPAMVAGQGAALAKFGWGSGEGHLGRERPTEGNPEAPMSVASAPGGSTWVLDQVNNRLVKLGKDGKQEATVPLTVQGPQDVAVGKDGTVAVMDRLLDKQVALYDANGKPLGTLPIEGKGLEEGGAASAVIIDGDSVYVEREHGDLVKVGDTKGVADPERGEVPGRPSRDGNTYLTALISSPPEGRVVVSATDRSTRQHRFTRELRLGVEVFGLNLLDTDQAGIIYLGAMVMNGTGPDGSKPGVLLLCLDPRDGTPLGRADLPPNLGPEETVRELTVLDQGGVLYLQRTEEGASLTRWDCR